MNGPRDYHTKRGQSNIIWCHLQVESEKTDTNELVQKTETDIYIENKLMATKGEMGGG